MRLLGLELNDASLTAVEDGGVLFAEPGYAVLTGDLAVFGLEARRRARLHPRATYNRFWRQLDDVPLPRPLNGFATALDLAQAQLRQLWAGCGAGVDGVVLAVPGYWGTETLGLLLGLAQELEIPIVGLTDAAVAASRRSYPGRALLHLEGSLHDVVVSRMHHAEGVISLGQRDGVETVGFETLVRGCVELIARRFVDESRFDPLHDAATEQYLYDRLPDWLARLARQPELALEIDHAGLSYRVNLEAAALRRRVAELAGPLLQRLRAGLAPDRPTVLQLNEPLARFPGLPEALAGLPGCEVYALEPGAAARGALRRAAHLTSRGGAFRLVTSLPPDQADAPAMSPAARPAVGGGPEPTHVLAGSRAYRLASAAFHIGTELTPGEYGLVLDGRSRGVSRRHCSIRLEDGRAVLNDHSRFGTLLNGHRVEGSVVLAAGDVVAVGDPAVEFRLVAEVTADGA